MLAMTAKGDVRAMPTLRNADKIDENTPDAAEASHRMPLAPGLSALIQAAQSQLELLPDDTSSAAQDEPSRIPPSGPQSEDGMSEDGAEKKLDAFTTTPTIVPEPDPGKQSFPELLMTLALEPSNNDVITFLPDGKYFAIRCETFSDQLMGPYFSISSFRKFLDLLHDWGFSRILEKQGDNTIEVFRHPRFIKGEWEKCSQIKYGESPSGVRVSALPDRVRIDCSLLDDCGNSKRRLSPGFLASQENEDPGTSQRQRIDKPQSDGAPSPSIERRTRSASVDSGVDESQRVRSHSSPSKADKIRSMALSITTEKMNIKQAEQEAKKAPLVDCAVESATHTIVTDAIETLLWDENHTKVTYLKHEKELSRSTIPGVVPISTQLFSPNSGTEQQESKPVQRKSSLRAVRRKNSLPLPEERKGSLSGMPRRNSLPAPLSEPPSETNKDPPVREVMARTSANGTRKTSVSRSRSIGLGQASC